MTISRIEQLIEDIYEFIESCRMQPLSTTRVIVPNDELYDLLDELRLRTPDEIKRYKKIIANRDAILADAEAKAKSIVEDADGRALSLINEHEIMQQAYYQANELVSNANMEAERILNQANYEANQIRANSLRYTGELLSDVDEVVSNTYKQAKKDYDILIEGLKTTLDTIQSNIKEVAIPEEYDEEEEELEIEDEPTSDPDLEFDENTFFNDIE